MTEQKYLKWWNIAGYGSGDVAGNVVYAFLTAFIMIYLTDTAGMNPGIIGTLILLSKLFDGLSDLFFGVLIDRTHSRMGKARPWMFWGYFGVALTLVGCFAIPESMGDTAKYAWFFIAYTLLNAVFYTANNIAYSALTALVTRNAGERVQMGSARFIFAFATSLAIQSVTVQSVDALGGGAEGWRMIAIIYAVIGLAVNSLSVFSVKELPEEELDADAPATGASPTGDGTGTAEHAPGFAETAVLLVRNRYYLLILGFLVVNQVLSTMMGMAIYYFTYILGDKTLVTPFAWAGNIPMIVGLVLTAYLAKTEIGMYRLNLAGYTITLVARVLVIVAAGMGSVPLMLVFTAVAQFGVSPMQGGAQRAHRRGLGVHVPPRRPPDRRRDVLLHVTGHQDRWRCRDRPRRVDAVRQRVRGQRAAAARLRGDDAPRHVPVDPRRADRRAPRHRPGVARRAGERRAPRGAGGEAAPDGGRPRDVTPRPPGGGAARVSARSAPGRGAGQRQSSSASPWPPPPHSETPARPPSRRCSSYAACTTRRAPEQPIGCPREMPPPWMFVFSSG